MRRTIHLLLLTAGTVLAVSAAAFAAPPGADVEAESPGPAAAVAVPLNGFEVSKANANREHIRGGGPGRDAIRSVDAPEFVLPALASWAPPPTAAIGVAIGEEARAYPVHLLEYHQIVNDTIAGTPVVVSFDPLTGISMAWKRTVSRGADGPLVLEFGVSGLLYREQFLLFDRKTNSLWAHYDGVAVAGPLAGTKLERVPSRQEPLGAWLMKHPNSLVMKRPEERKIDYRHSPYEAYWVSESVPLTVRASDERFHPKEVVVGLEVDGKQRAYLGSILTAEGGRIVDTFEGRKIRIQYDTNLGLFICEAPDDVSVTDAYWFAWKSLHPDTEIWHDPGAGT